MDRLSGIHTLNPKLEMEGQSGFPVPLENVTSVPNNKLKPTPSTPLRSSHCSLNTHCLD